MSGDVGWFVVYRDFNEGGREYRAPRNHSLDLALNEACDLLRQQHEVVRIEGPDNEVIEREIIEQHCRTRPRPP